MNDRPYVLLSCAMSIDGYIDDATTERLMLSNDADFDRVDAVRAEYDAILVGASTIRQDNPRLLVRSQERRNARTAAGRGQSPTKVTISGRGELSPDAQFFTAGDIEKIVYTSSSVIDKAKEQLGHVATVVDAGDPLDLRAALADLSSRGIESLMVEGGGSMHTQFLANNLADELHLVVAPFFVGDPIAPKFIHDGRFPHNRHNRARLIATSQIDDVVLLRYALSERFHS